MQRIEKINNQVKASEESWKKPFSPKEFMDALKKKIGHEKEFIQAVQEIVDKLGPFLD